ncbi:MAG: ATP-dependent DNA helicase [Candidatus Omnitrophota bacterium]
MATREVQKTLEGLNPEQREAVTATEGPVLIVAGAGTGKTRVITTRVAYLLAAKKDLRPENILALTFTDKATDEMQERVESVVEEGANDIWISTFHAFARKILSENGSHIGIPANFKILDDVEKWIILKKLLPDLKLNYYLQLADPSAVLKSFVSFISRAKDELILPGEYVEYAGKLRASYEKTKSGMNSDERKSMELEVKREEEVARIYSTYQKRSLEESALDFGDLIIYTIKLFQERPNILAQYSDQFKYIVVDEFQDTNIAQIELLKMLSKKWSNICVVGDDDQAIYRFRGASYASFLKFKEHFANRLKTVKLTQNYRSSKRILNIADRLIVNNGQDRYDPKKNLWTEDPEGPPVKAIVAHDYKDEASAVADEIEALYAGLKGENKKYSDIAVLYRAHSHKDTLLNELKRRGIPVAVVKGAGLLHTEEIRDIVAYLKVVQDPEDSISLFRVLTSPVWEIDIEDLITIYNVASREECPIYDYIKDPGRLNSLSEKTLESIKEFRESLKDLMRVSKRENAVESFLGILEKTGYLTRLIKKGHEARDAESDQKALNIGKFFRFISTYLRNNPDQSLPGFMQYLSFFISGGGDTEQEELIFNADAVRFMTVHSAKGLEFPYVFLISLVQNRFPTMKRRETIPFPVALMKEELPKGDFHRGEERRLCYVAMTRARKALFLSGIDKSRNRLSMFLKEVLSAEAIKAGDIALTEIEPSDDIESRIGNTLLDRLKRIEGKNEEYKLPKPGKLSYTQLDMYQNCPLKYKFGYVYRIPTRRRNALTFGSSIHATLEDFFTLVQEGKKVDKGILFKILDKHWNKFGFTSKMDEANYRKTGEKSLEVFYDKHKAMFGKPPLFLEKKVDLKVGPFVLDVRIDRIDSLEGKKVEIVDYKTGKPKDEDFAQNSLQLSIYALACKEVLKLNPTMVSFYYVNPNKKVTSTRNKEDYDQTKKTIIDIGTKIHAEEFEPTPGRLCNWCDYKSICPVWDKR